MPAQPNAWIVPVTVVLLAGYAVAALVALLSPSNDPQRGMANGFIVMVLFVLLLFGGMLWFGLHPYRPILVWTIFVITAYPAVMLVAQRLYLIYRGMSNR